MGLKAGSVSGSWSHWAPGRRQEGGGGSREAGGEARTLGFALGKPQGSRGGPSGSDGMWAQNGCISSEGRDSGPLSRHSAGTRVLDVALGPTSFYSAPGGSEGSEVQAGERLTQGGVRSRARPDSPPQRSCLFALWLPESDTEPSSPRNCAQLFLASGPHCSQAPRADSFPTHPLCLAPLQGGSQQAVCTPGSAHAGGVGPALGSTVRVEVQGSSPTPALCTLITWPWHWADLPVTHRQRTEGPGEQEGRDVGRGEDGVQWTASTKGQQAGQNKQLR